MIIIKYSQHNFKDRLCLKPYLGQQLEFHGTILKIRHLMYHDYRAVFNLLIVSIQATQHDIEIDHVNVLARPSQIKHLKAYNRIKFIATVYTYNAKRLIRVPEYKAPMEVFNPTYGLEDAKGFEVINEDDQTKAGLSTWCLHQIKANHLNLEKYITLPNNGNREENMIKDIQKNRSEHHEHH